MLWLGNMQFVLTMLARSTPMCPANIPSLPADAIGLVASLEEISETLVPYARNNSGVGGNNPSNNAPSLRAVLCRAPTSASFFFVVEILSYCCIFRRSLEPDKSKVGIDVDQGSGVFIVET